MIRDIVRGQIKEKFGESVLSIVNGESEDKFRTWKERKQHTIYQSIYENLDKIDEAKYPMKKQLEEYVKKVFFN